MIPLEKSVPVFSTFFRVSCAMSAHEERYLPTPCTWIGLARRGCAGDVISNWHTLPNHRRPSSWVFGTLGRCDVSCSISQTARRQDPNTGDLCSAELVRSGRPLEDVCLPLHARFAVSHAAAGSCRRQGR